MDYVLHMRPFALPGRGTSEKSGTYITAADKITIQSGFFAN
jgi:hypothetical protein